MLPSSERASCKWHTGVSERTILVNQWTENRNCNRILTSTSVHKLRKGKQILYFLNLFIPLLYHIYFCYLYTNLLISFHLTLLLIHYPFYPYVIIHVPFPFICNLYPFILFRLSISLLSLSFYSYLFIPSLFSPIPLFLSLYPSE